MQKVCLGIPYYSDTPGEWWNPLIAEVAGWHKEGIELIAPISVRGMMVDLSRNNIIQLFLETEAEWLQWIDADNIPKVGLVKRLLSTQKSLVTGIYVKRGENPEPVLYHSGPNGMYGTVEAYRVGEILPIDAAGLGGLLMHRTVAEDIRKNYRLLERSAGGITIVHKNDIEGDIFDIADDTDGKVIDGVFHDRLRQPTTKHDFPWFMIEYARTEDYGFFERAKRSGHQLWCDTSVELGHIGYKINQPSDWRKLLREVQEASYARD